MKVPPAVSTLSDCQGLGRLKRLLCHAQLSWAEGHSFGSLQRVGARCGLGACTGGLPRTNGSALFSSASRPVRNLEDGRRGTGGRLMPCASVGFWRTTGLESTVVWRSPTSAASTSGTAVTPRIQCLRAVASRRRLVGLQRQRMQVGGAEVRVASTVRRLTVNGPSLVPDGRRCWSWSSVWSAGACAFRRPRGRRGRGVAARRRLREATRPGTVRQAHRRRSASVQMDWRCSSRKGRIPIHGASGRSAARRWVRPRRD